jgi:hypothetical protein
VAELVLESLDCVAEVPSVELATVTGALAFTGSLRETDGLTAVEPTCTVPSDCELPGSAAAGATPQPSAMSAAPSAHTRFMIVFHSFLAFERVVSSYRTSRQRKDGARAVLAGPFEQELKGRRP